MQTGKASKFGTAALPVWIGAQTWQAGGLRQKGAFASNGDAEGIQGICASRQRHGHGGRHHHWRRLLPPSCDRWSTTSSFRRSGSSPAVSTSAASSSRSTASIIARSPAKQAGAPTINIGLFINNVISFLIVTFVLFMVIKAMNQLRRMQAEDPASEPPPSREVELLTEIRDALVKRS